MEKKSNAGVIVLIVVLLLVSLGLVGFIVYDKVLNKEEIKNVENKIEDKKDEEEVNKIDLKDKLAYALDNAYDKDKVLKLRLQLFLLEDGYLYYKIKFIPITENIYEYTMDLPTSSEEEPKLQKYTKLKNIKRIKGTNTISNGVAFNILAITEEGKVYDISTNEDGEISYYLNEDFKKYQVDDILEYEPIGACIDDEGGATCISSFTIITKDGQKITQ